MSLDIKLGDGTSVLWVSGSPETHQSAPVVGDHIDVKGNLYKVVNRVFLYDDEETATKIQLIHIFVEKVGFKKVDAPASNIS